MATKRVFALMLAFALASSAYPDKNFLEILKPIPKPKGARRCSIPVLKNHVFGKAPFTASLSPPPLCGKSWSLVTLSWSVYLNTTTVYESSGNIFIDGINILKTSAKLYAPEDFRNGKPRAGAYWNFEVDLTKYGSYLKKTRQLTLNFRFPDYFKFDDFYSKGNLTLNYYTGPTPSRFANVILPLSPKSKPNSPFNITYTSNKGQVSLSGLPRNIYRAEIEIFQIQGGSDEEYWYEFQPRKQPYGFRETLVYIDGLLAGSTWPFPVQVHETPFYWQLARYTGTYVRPTYKVDITPFVGLLVNGKSHNITLAIAGASKGSFWELSGALHLWLDTKSKQTSGKLISRQIANTVTPIVVHKYKSEINRNTTTTATRASKIVGSVSTSFGTFTVTVDSSRQLYNYIRYVGTVIESCGCMWTDANVTHIIRGSNSVDMKFQNGSRLFRYSDIFSYPLVKNNDFSGGYSGFYNIGQGQFLNTTTQYGKNAPRVDTLSNTQSLTLIAQFREYTSGNFSQRFSYRSNFDGCLYNSVQSDLQSNFIHRGRRTC